MGVYELIFELNGFKRKKIPSKMVNNHKNSILSMFSPCELGLGRFFGSLLVIEAPQKFIFREPPFWPILGSDFQNDTEPIKRLKSRKMDI